MKIGITAITGKMSKKIAELVASDPIAELTSGFVKTGNNFDGVDLGEFLAQERTGKKITSNIDEFIKNCEAIIDFSSPFLSLECAKKAAEYGKIMVCGTTGFSDEEKKQLADYAKNCVIIWSSNMSVGINLLMNLAEKVAKILHNDYDVEIVEMHHREKIDAPSGTAISLGAAVAKGRGIDLQESGKMARIGKNNKRQKGEIGFASLRGGDVIGDHSIIFAGDGERIELTHKASNRDVFARGAIRAAIWGSGQKHGFYLMKDVLGS
jgi:4-hydroxy-tetrahydrodipicolinate reductase